MQQTIRQHAERNPNLPWVVRVDLCFLCVKKKTGGGARRMSSYATTTAVGGIVLCNTIPPRRHIYTYTTWYVVVPVLMVSVQECKNGVALSLSLHTKYEVCGTAV